MPTITVVGLGFVGLTTALGLSEKGFQVYGLMLTGARRKKFKAAMFLFMNRD